MINKKITIIFVLVLFSQKIISQVVINNQKIIADDFYNKGDYSSAIKYYQLALSEKENKEKINSPYQMQAGEKKNKAGKLPYYQTCYNIAESYRLLHNYEQAEPWYAKLVKEDIGDYPLTSLYYGISLRANGKFELAKDAIDAFIAKYKTKDIYLQQAKKELSNLLFILQQPAVSDIIVSKLNKLNNHEGADYAAAWLNDNTLLFTSTRLQQNTSKAKSMYKNALFISAPVINDGKEITKLILPPIGEDEYGVASVSNDGNKIYFTGWTTSASGHKKSSIYMSEKKNDQWSKAIKLQGGINGEDFNARQPCITADGKYLFFSSDRPGGKGGFDIWYAILNTTGEPGNAINAGPIINTKGNEESPFYHAPDKTLVFASDGRIGMGGYDLYASNGSIQNWSEPQNIGSPVNSIKDDLYFVSRGIGLLDDVLLSSDRSSQCCLELFELHKKSLPVIVAVDPKKDSIAIVKPAPEVENIFSNSKILVTHDILFDFDEAIIDSSSFVFLNRVTAYLLQNPTAGIEIGAHTDTKGSAEYNIKLSAKRAKACVDYFISKGIAISRLIAKGYGECCPLQKETTEDGKDNPEGRHQNRRIELKLLQE